METIADEGRHTAWDTRLCTLTLLFFFLGCFARPNKEWPYCVLFFLPVGFPFTLSSLCPYSVKRDSADSWHRRNTKASSFLLFSPHLAPLLKLSENPNSQNENFQGIRGRQQWRRRYCVSGALVVTLHSALSLSLPSSCVHNKWYRRSYKSESFFFFPCREYPRHMRAVPSLRPSQTSVSISLYRDALQVTQKTALL